MANKTMDRMAGYFHHKNNPNFEIFWLNEGELGREVGCAASNEAGWFWWSCAPGCMPDSDPIGPFEDSYAAWFDATQRM